ncbi:MAG: winged helix-turn-helix transcriptional regulator [Candidatus Hermodarchaeota archaeon]
MDLLDKRILTELTRNCRITYQELSSKIGLTATGTRKRVENLIDDGTLYSFSIRPTLNSMNADIAIALVETDGQESPADFLESFGENESVGEVNPIATKDGGFYLVISDYIGANGIINLGSFLRTLDYVEKVDMHSVITDPQYHGNSVEFKPLELRVMKYLTQDARMTVSEISEKSNLTVRRVRNILKKLQEDGGVNFLIRWNTAAAGAVRFFLPIEYNPKDTNHEDLINWLFDAYPKEFWLYWISTNKPLIFASFTAESIEEARRISLEVQENSVVSSVETWICYPPRKFKTYPEKWLEEKLSQI